MHRPTNNKIANNDGLYDVVLANFLVVEIDKLDLDASGFTTCCVVEMTWVNMTDSYLKELSLDNARSHGYFRMSTEQFGYVLRLV